MSPPAGIVSRSNSHHVSYSKQPPSLTSDPPRKVENALFCYAKFVALPNFIATPHRPDSHRNLVHRVHNAEHVYTHAFMCVASRNSVTNTAKDEAEQLDQIEGEHRLVFKLHRAPLFTSNSKVQFPTPDGESSDPITTYQTYYGTRQSLSAHQMFSEEEANAGFWQPTGADRLDIPRQTTVPNLRSARISSVCGHEGWSPPA